MPFKSRKQQKWYHATDQSYLDGEPHAARKVEGEASDLTTPAGGEIPLESDLETPQGSNKGFEVKQGDRVDLGDGQFGVVANQHPHNPNIWFVTSKGNYYEVPEEQLKIISSEVTDEEKILKRGEQDPIAQEEFNEQEHPRDSDGKFGSGGGSNNDKHSKTSTKDLIKSIKGGSKNWKDWYRNENNEEAYAEIEKRNREVPRPKGKIGGAIFRDDPDAVSKMENKVKVLEERQEYWKAITKFPARDYKNRNQLGDMKWYELSNLGANLRDTRKKLQGIKDQQGRGTTLVRKPTYPDNKKRFYYSEEPKGESLLEFEGKIYAPVKADEEGMATVSGPPADSNINYIEDDPTILTNQTEENLTEDNLTEDNLTDDEIGEENLQYILLNENYIQDQFGVFYRPVYVGENYIPYHTDLIFNNKIYTTEGLGNCVFCQGAGKVTVENLGLKDCPDCDGTGDVQTDPMADPMGQIDPMAQVDPMQQEMPDPQQGQQPNDGAPDKFGADPNQQIQQAQMPQQPSQEPATPESQPKEQPNPEEEKPQFGESFLPAIDKAIDKLINERLSKRLGVEENPNHDDDGKFSSGSGGSEDNKTKAKGILQDIRDAKFRDKDGNIDWGTVEKKRKEAVALTKSSESCGCKKKAHEANVKKYKAFIAKHISVLQSRAQAGEAVSVMYGLPTISTEGRKIKGTLAYAGVSLNDRIYLPETLAKGDGKTLPLLLNHSNVAGAEEELDRLDDEMVEYLYAEKDYRIGEVTLRWDPEKLTLFYEGVVEHPFFQKEIDDADMAVSLGIYYDSDSPKICDEHCYTMIKGAEFREVSLVYHAGFPIATIEAVENELKRNARQAMEGDGYFKTDVGYACNTCGAEIGTEDNIKNHIETAHNKANEDHLENLAKLEKEEKKEGEPEQKEEGGEEKKTEGDKKASGDDKGEKKKKD
ncbi:hypothetical protein LCGC14_1220540 [marine sediment metagenome]|uniref:C2H2-type domain-containing protein n=1 Tax=marine sediment metagenome TaxID=412755 RepID=A0A0F9PFW6_9ZZZZ